MKVTKQKGLCYAFVAKIYTLCNITKWSEITNCSLFVSYRSTFPWWIEYTSYEKNDFKLRGEIWVSKHQDWLSAGIYNNLSKSAMIQLHYLYSRYPKLWNKHMLTTYYLGKQCSNMWQYTFSSQVQLPVWWFGEALIQRQELWGAFTARSNLIQIAC